MEITEARAYGRMYVDDLGGGYVHRLHRWLSFAGTDQERECAEGSDWVV